jgi:arylsulfatase A
MGACGTTRDGQQVHGPRPNLVVVLADDLGAETLGCYGGESYATPNLDRMAEDGVRFENAFTQPLCTPTRVELLTGRSNARNYRSFSVLDPAEQTFAHMLREGGYRTCAVGKWQLLGAEHYGDDIRGQGSLPGAAGFEHHALWQVESLGARHWKPTMTVDARTRTYDADVYGPDLALEYALDWIDNDDPKPFLLFWPMILPHSPFIAPPGVEGPHEPPGDVAQFGPMVEHLDRQVGRLLQHLEQRGLDEDTWVLFIGDNGSPRQARSLRRGQWVDGGKKHPNDAGSRVPFLVLGPGKLQGGTVIEDPVSTVDVFATLIELAGLELPRDREFDGWSFLPRLDGRAPQHREWVTFHHRPRPLSKPESPARRWARDARWQLFEEGDLFDTATDPTLEEPLSAEMDGPEQRAARLRLRAALDTLPRPATE